MFGGIALAGGGFGGGEISKPIGYGGSEIGPPMGADGMGEITEPVVFGIGRK